MIETEARRHAAADTSAKSLEAMGWRRLAGMQKDIFEVVLAAQKGGARDLSLTEIQRAFERRHGRRIELSSVSARVHGLVTAGRLVRLEDIRPCSITGRAIHPVCVPAQQARLFG